MFHIPQIIIVFLFKYFFFDWHYHLISYHNSFLNLFFINSFLNEKSTPHNGPSPLEASIFLNSKFLNIIAFYAYFII